MKVPGVRWYYDTLTPRMAAFTIVVDQVLEEALERAAEEVENYAKEHAPWEVRTGDAREGLTAELQRGSGKFVILLYHTVDYGIWLEIRNSGEYAIILPTIEVM